MQLAAASSCLKDGGCGLLPAEFMSWGPDEIALAVDTFPIRGNPKMHKMFVDLSHFQIHKDELKHESSSSTGGLASCTSK